MHPTKFPSWAKRGRTLFSLRACPSIIAEIYSPDWCSMLLNYLPIHYCALVAQGAGREMSTMLNINSISFFELFEFWQCTTILIKHRICIGFHVGSIPVKNENLSRIDPMWKPIYQLIQIRRGKPPRIDSQPVSYIPMNKIVPQRLKWPDGEVKKS